MTISSFLTPTKVWNLVSKTSLDGSAGTTTITIPSTYDYYLIVIKGMYAGGGANNLLLRNNGVSTATYYYRNINSASVSNSATQTSIFMADTLPISSNTSFSGEIRFCRLSKTFSIRTCSTHAVSGVNTIMGRQDDTGPITDITLFSSGGAVLTGTILLFGLSES